VQCIVAAVLFEHIVVDVVVGTGAHRATQQQQGYQDEMFHLSSPCLRIAVQLSVAWRREHGSGEPDYKLDSWKA
jgi:hypothetical protein